MKILPLPYPFLTRCDHTARLWRHYPSLLLPVLLIFQKCVSRQVSDKTQYPTFIRTSPLAHQVTKSVLSLLIHFRWRHFTIVSGSSEAWQSISAQLEDMALRFRLALNHPIQLFQEPYSAGSDQSDPVEIWDIVENTYIDTRGKT